MKMQEEKCFDEGMRPSKRENSVMGASVGDASTKEA